MFVVLGASGNTGKVVAETLLRRKKKWQIACQGVLFHDGDIVELGEKAEKAEDDA